MLHKFFILFLVIFVLLFLIMVIVEFYSWELLFKSLIWLTITVIQLIIIDIDTLTTIVLVYITQYYFCLKSQKINDSIKGLVNDNEHNILRTIKLALIEHNELCSEIHSHNKITKKLYMYAVFNNIPINLFMLHQYLFEDLKFYVQIIVVFIITMQSLTIFVFQFYFASISASIHKPLKILYRLQWNLNGWPFRMGTKIKLLSYFERLSSNRKIGVTIGSIAVMTFPLFSQVYIFYNLSINSLNIIELIL